MKPNLFASYSYTEEMRFKQIRDELTEQERFRITGKKEMNKNAGC